MNSQRGGREAAVSLGLPSTIQEASGGALHETQRTGSSSRTPPNAFLEPRTVLRFANTAGKKPKMSSLHGAPPTLGKFQSPKGRVPTKPPREDVGLLSGRFVTADTKKRNKIGGVAGLLNPQSPPHAQRPIRRFEATATTTSTTTHPQSQPHR